MSAKDGKKVDEPNVRYEAALVSAADTFTTGRERENVVK